MWIACLAIAALYIASTALTPLYPIYRHEFVFSELVVTEIYAVYVVGNLACLFFFGRLSDQIGRRRTALIAFAITALSAVLFLIAQGTGELMAARIVNGFSAGLGAGALTAWIAELEPSGNKARAAVAASSANLFGLAFGGVLAGLLAELAPAPLRTVFVVYLGILVVVGLLLSRVNETVEHPTRDVRSLSLRPRIGVPREIRAAFVAPACMTFAAFALGGFYAALTPGVLSEKLNNTAPSVTGAVVGLFFASACAAAAASRSLRSRTAMFTGSALLFPGLALLIGAELAKSMLLVLLASVVSGAAMSLSYRGSLQVVNEIAPREKRAEVVSTYLLMCYSGNALPVIGVGLLSLPFGATAAHIAFAAVCAALGLTAIIAGLANRRRALCKETPRPERAPSGSRRAARGHPAAPHSHSTR
jgi:MFS family permease